jgi:hypothetical protein
VIRPFQFGDIFLIQRLGRQSAKLGVVQALLQPQSAVWASLSAIVPWNDGKVATYVLRQQGHGLVGIGYLQARKRPGRPEVEITSLAPGLDAARGHPAIWEKLLSHYNGVAAQGQIARIYVDVPDQPLPVNTFCQVGFRTYARQSIWRLARHDLTAYPHPISAKIRSQSKADEWALRSLYTRTVPKSVQEAEGIIGPTPTTPPIVEWGHVGACSSYVLEERGDLLGSVQVVQGERGYWLQLWADFYDPDNAVLHQLLRFGLGIIAQRRDYQPVYVGVCDYHGSLGTLLTEYGFAPITDRAKMVRPVMQWIREFALEPSLILKRTAPVIGAPFIVPAPPPTVPPFPSQGVASPAPALLGDDGNVVVSMAGNKVMQLLSTLSDCPDKRQGAEMVKEPQL